MNDKTKVALIVLVVTGLMMLLNAALGSSGASSNASLPEAKEAARKVDESILDWLTWLLVGTGAAGAGVVVEKRKQKRKARAAALESAQKGGRS